MYYLGLHAFFLWCHLHAGHYAPFAGISGLDDALCHIPAKHYYDPLLLGMLALLTELLTCLTLYASGL